VVAGITTRADGFNLGFGTADEAQKVSARWRAFLAAAQPSFTGAVLGHQIHGTAIRPHATTPTEGLQVLDGVDGHLTTAAGALLAVTVADCVPVYLTTRDGGAVGLVHAGWRGIAGGIVEAGVRRLAALAGSPDGDIVIHCGVSICGACYEVGSEVISAVSGRLTEGKALLDLRAEIATRARAAGVREITASPYCSAHDQDLFFSHRRSGGKDGRMIAYLGRPLA
jgi:hypothetical protein